MDWLARSAADGRRYSPLVDAERQADDGDGREFQRVTDALRIQLTDGTFPVGSVLPAERDLAEEFEVSRHTVQRSLRCLAREGWIETGQGGRTRVIRNQRLQPASPGATWRHHGKTLGPLISEAFEQEDVALDVFTLTSESLGTHIRLQAERIRRGSIAPERISVRLLLPDDTQDLPYVGVKDDPSDRRLQERLHAIRRRHVNSLSCTLIDLQVERLVDMVEVSIRRTPLVPLFKLYVFNGVEVLHGVYELVERRLVLEDTGEEVDALDVLGLGATLTHHIGDTDPGSPGSVFVATMRSWFDSAWDLRARAS